MLLIAARRQSIEQTLLVKLTDGELSFHARLHTPRDALTLEDEKATLIYMSTSDISVGTFLVIKLLSLCLIGLGLLLVGQAVPPFASQIDFVDVLTSWAVRIGLALAFLFMALVFLRKRSEVADALSILRVDPLSGLSDSAKNVLEEAISGGNPLAAAFTETVGRAVAKATPVRVWAILVPIFAIALAAELVLSQIFR